MTNKYGYNRPTKIREANKKEAKKAQKTLASLRKKGIVPETKLDEFLAEFLKNGGNATDAADAVFNCSSRAVASSMGSQYLQKSKVLVRAYLDHHGASWGKLVQIALDKAEVSMKPDWWDRLMKLADIDINECYITNTIK